MATTTEKRVIIIDVKGASEAVKDLKALQRHAANSDKNIARMGKTMGNLGFTIKAFIAYRLTAYLAGIGPAFIGVADSMSLMKSRLSLVNEGTGDLSQTMNELFDVAERSRGSIDSISTLYTRLSVSAKELGASQQEVMDFTELVSDTFLLSGASAGEAASGVTQISQAMAKGKLDGDEFKSVMENNVYFGKLLAESLGVTRGELLKLSKEGKITSDILLKMGLSVDEVRKMVAEMPSTTAQMFTAWGNAFAKMISDSETLNNLLDRFNTSMINSANKIADVFDDSPIVQANEAIAEEQLLVDALQIKLTQMTGPMEDMSVFFRTLKSTNLDRFNMVLDVTFSKFRQANTDLKALRENLEQDLAHGRGEVGPMQPTKPGAGDTKDTPFSKWLESVKKADAAIVPLHIKMKALDDLMFGHDKQQISDSVYDQFMDKLQGMSETSGGVISDAQANLAELNEIIASGRTPAEELADEIARINAIVAKTPELAGAGAEAIEVLTESFDKNQLKKNEEAWVDWAQVAETGVKGVTGALIDMALSGKNSFEDFARSFLINIAKMIAQAAILKSLQGASGSGGFLGLFPSANGNVFNGGNIVPFANGGIIDSPTIFPMASGAALIGEAGPEAVLPLSRGTDGKLGVKSTGSGDVTVNIANYGNSEVSQSSGTDSQGGRTIDIVIEEKVNAAMKQGGMDRSMGSNFGIKRVGY